MAEAKPNFNLNFGDQPKQNPNVDSNEIDVSKLKPEELQAYMIESQLAMPEAVGDVSDAIDELRETQTKLCEATLEIVKELKTLREGLQDAFKKFAG